MCVRVAVCASVRFLVTSLKQSEGDECRKVLVEGPVSGTPEIFDTDSMERSATTKLHYRKAQLGRQTNQRTRGRPLHRSTTGKHSWVGRRTRGHGVGHYTDRLQESTVG